jgi:hypothetical protein
LHFPTGSAIKPDNFQHGDKDIVKKKIACLLAAGHGRMLRLRVLPAPLVEALQNLQHGIARGLQGGFAHGTLIKGHMGCGKQ